MLFWGILGALVMRAIFILAGVALIARFHWTIYVFGVFLVFTGVRMLLSRGEHGHPENNVMVRLARRVLPVAPGQDTDHFFARVGRKMDGDPAVPGSGGGGVRPTSSSRWIPSRRFLR